MFTRSLLADIGAEWFQGRAVVVVGPRQSGKTTLMEAALAQKEKAGPLRVVRYNGDYAEDRDFLSGDFGPFRGAVADADAVFVDEAQKIPRIGDQAKSFVDLFKKTKQLFLTGSSSVRLLDHSGEPLTGRKTVFPLYPISYAEIAASAGAASARKSLEAILRFGTYPAVLTETSDARRTALLRELYSGAAYRDVLEFQGVRNSAVISRLLKLLALQVGQLVSFSEIGGILGVDSRTVERYVDLLEKSFVLFRVSPFFANKRKEITKAQKIYFTDLGLRNAAAGDLRPLDQRTDVGALWENFVAAEFHKREPFGWPASGLKYWRQLDGQEVDLVLETDGRVDAYEAKWSKTSAKVPPGFGAAYPKAKFHVVTKENFTELLG